MWIIIAYCVTHERGYHIVYFGPFKTKKDAMAWDLDNDILRVVGARSIQIEKLVKL